MLSGPPRFTCGFLLFGIQFNVPLSPYIFFISFLYLNLYQCSIGDDAWIR